MASMFESDHFMCEISGALTECCPSAADEKSAECRFKILGSTFILLGDFEKGLECWKKSSLLGSSKLVNDEPEWSNFDAAGEKDGSMEQYYDSDEKKLNLMYQAVPIRLRYCKQECRSDVRQLCKFIRTLSVDSEAYVKFAVLLFECDELYAGHSLTLESEVVFDVFFHVTHALTLRSEKYECVEFSVHYERIMVVLKWLTTEFQNAIFLGAQVHPDNLKNFDFAMMSVNHMLIALSELWLTPEQENEYKRCIKRFGLINWRNSEGRNLVLENCKWLSQNTTSGLYACKIKKVTLALIAEGTYLDIADHYGKTCLDYLQDSNINLFDV